VAKNTQRGSGGGSSLRATAVSTPRVRPAISGRSGYSASTAGPTRASSSSPFPRRSWRVNDCTTFPLRASSRCSATEYVCPTTPTRVVTSSSAASALTSSVMQEELSSQPSSCLDRS